MGEDFKFEEEIAGALARGYTYPENSSKVLDADLINAMQKEVMKVIKTATDILEGFNDETSRD
jgi:hypothetical protein